MRTTFRFAAAASILAVVAGAWAALPADPDFAIYRPSNTGIPGQSDMRFVAFGPDGRLWTHGRDFFWQQGGVAALDFDTGLWKTWSSAETPLDQFSNAIAFEADGSAWIAGDDVINHLSADGETFTTYTPASTGVLVGNSYEAITIAPNGHVWVSNPGQVDLGGGLFEFDGTVWTKHEEPWMTTWTGFGFAPALNVLARSNGDVWATFQSSPGRVAMFRDGGWTVFDSGPYMIDYAESPSGTLYGVSAFGTFRLNDATMQWQQIGPFGASRIAVDPTDEDLYIKSDLNTVKRYNGVGWSTFATFPGWVDAITVAPDGDVWITAEAWGTHYDLHHYNQSGQLLRVYNRSNTGMLDYFQPGMYVDRDGIMWFTDAEYGATRMEPDGNWRNFGIYNGQEEVYPAWVSPVGLPWWQTPGADFWTESVDQVFQDSRGDFWLRGPNHIARSHGDDLSQWDRWTPGQAGFPSLCDSMGEDALGNIWVGDAFVLNRLVGSSWTQVIIGNPDQFAPIGLEQGDDGELYAVRISTVYHVIGTTTTPLYSAPDGFGVITDLEVDAGGNMWIGTPNGLIYFDGTTTVYTPDNSAMSDLAVIDVTIRPGDGLIAVATSQQEIPPYTGGVALHDPASGEWIGYDYGSSFMPFYAPGEVQFDADGHLWVGVLNFGAVKVFLGDSSAPGDLDGDGDVDLVDFAGFQLCFTGPGGAVSEGACQFSDFDGDGDCDLVDFNQFQLAFTGAS